MHTGLVSWHSYLCLPSSRTFFLPAKMCMHLSSLSRVLPALRVFVSFTSTSEHYFMNSKKYKSCPYAGFSSFLSLPPYGYPQRPGLKYPQYVTSQFLTGVNANFYILSMSIYGTRFTSQRTPSLQFRISWQCHGAI